MSDVNAKVRELQSINTSLEAKCRQLQEYQEQYLLTKQRLAAAERTTNNWKSNIHRLKANLASALKREKLFTANQRTPSRISSKGNMWKTFSNMWQRITSANK